MPSQITAKATSIATKNAIAPRGTIASCSRTVVAGAIEETWLASTLVSDEVDIFNAPPECLALLEPNDHEGNHPETVICVTVACDSHHRTTRPALWLDRQR